LLALATDGVVLSVGLIFFISPRGDHVLEVGDGALAATTEVFKGATVVETVLKEVDGLLVGDVDYGGACRRSTACTCEGSRLVPALPFPGPCEYPSDP
jgi:hypothetical protein